MPLFDPIYGYSGQPTFQPAPGIPQPYPVQPPVPQPAANPLPFVKIVTLAGADAAKSLKLAPGSTLIAADENESVLWFIKANEVGPNTVVSIPFDPSIFNGGPSAPNIDLSAIEGRLSSIEERMSKYESNDGTDKRGPNGNNSGNSNNRR